MVERIPLDKEEIGTERDVAVKLEDGSGNRNGFEGRDVGRGGSTVSRTFKVSHVWTIDDQGTPGVVRRDWAVANEVPTEDPLEFGFGGPANATIKVASGFGGSNLPGREKFLLLSNGLKKRVRGRIRVRVNSVIHVVRVINVEPTFVFNKLHNGTI